MRIIDNKKDYYDWLVGKFGLDGHITYDRRNSTRLVNKTSSSMLYDKYPMGWGHIFCTWKNGRDPKDERNMPTGYDWDTPKSSFPHRKYKEFPGAYNVKSNFFGLVIGSVAYVFLVHRVLQNENDKEVKLIPKLMRKFTFDRSRTKTTAPILVGELSYSLFDIPFGIRVRGKADEYYEALSKVGYIAPDRDGKYQENPIMEGTWIPSLIPAEEVWNNITDYLLSIKEPPIIDNRTDVQHLESHGFDKKTSFRNVK